MAKLSDRQKSIIRNKISKRRVTRPFKDPDFPDMIVMEYGKAIIKEVNKIDKLVKEILVPELNRITNTKSERLDDGAFKKLAGVALVAALIRKIKSKFYGESLSEDQEPRQTFFSKSIKRLSDPFIKRADNFQKTKFVKEFERQTGTKPIEKQLDTKLFLDEALARNVNLIKTVPAKYLSDISNLVENAVRTGQLSSEVSKKLKEIKGTARKNSRFIARDQIGKLTGDVNEVRQKNLGVAEYIWRTMQDSRVRSLANTKGVSDHKHLDGTIQRWDSPPVTVFSGKRVGQRHHPKSDFGCRCEAQAVFDSITGIVHHETVAARKKTEQNKVS